MPTGFAADPASLAGALAALAAVLALIALLAWAARRSGLGAGARAGRRLVLVEVLALDPRRRLLLVRCDGREALLLTGGGQDALLGWLPAREEAPRP
ncbi:flagellar biosynthetic protein FliO [Caldovatus aquaticus]|uniref:Flagellar biosynthetic protein FliO n=1 Tax=Caldovatus aquaticus TaxID=2865671 RepID=A0ABS7F4Z3_9PROT|nr:flagellar biosynthetic protein FliO [Caldovatus aquaticus]MBW8269830.1 flagellar biosynthetic protein FliO [Caldovatus aquaticus]